MYVDRGGRHTDVNYSKYISFQANVVLHRVYSEQACNLSLPPSLSQARCRLSVCLSIPQIHKLHIQASNKVDSVSEANLSKLLSTLSFSGDPVSYTVVPNSGQITTKTRRQVCAHTPKSTGRKAKNDRTIRESDRQSTHFGKSDGEMSARGCTQNTRSGRV